MSCKQETLRPEIFVDVVQEALYHARMNKLSALKKAVRLVGGQTALAKTVDVKQGHVWWWLNKSGKAPAEKCIGIERATNGAVTRHELRPDIYPLEPGIV